MASLYVDVHPQDATLFLTTWEYTQEEAQNGNWDIAGTPYLCLKSAGFGSSCRSLGVALQDQGSDAINVSDFAAGVEVALFISNGSQQVEIASAFTPGGTPPPPPEPTYTDWAEISANLPQLQGDAVTGFRIEQTLVLLKWIWDRYEGAIEYQLVIRPGNVPTFELFATVPQGAGPEIELSYPNWQNDARFVPGALMIYRLRARLT